jgi:acrylyl-CoA reductase (NADPH)
MPRAIVIRPNSGPAASGPINLAAVEEVDVTDLGDDPVLVEVHYSGINYKDGLALTGRPGIVRSTPLIGGVDLVGTVVSSDSPLWQPGDEVILNGTGMSETHNGGFSELARVPADFLVQLPQGLSQARAAALGTAGYTAALCVLRLERERVDASLPLLVTGATGGVGSIAIALLAAKGYQVAALSGRTEQYGDYLLELGASQVVARSELLGNRRPLQQTRWAGGLDTVGGEVLANLLAQTSYGGTVAACGLAGSADLPATVMPFILRNVTLAGVDSVQAPLAQRQAAWNLLSTELDLELLDRLTETVPLTDTIEAAGRLMAGQTHGRIVVDVRA